MLREAHARDGNRAPVGSRSHFRRSTGGRSGGKGRVALPAFCDGRRHQGLSTPGRTRPSRRLRCEARRDLGIELRRDPLTDAVDGRLAEPDPAWLQVYRHGVVALSGCRAPTRRGRKPATSPWSCVRTTYADRSASTSSTSRCHPSIVRTATAPRPTERGRTGDTYSESVSSRTKRRN